MNLSEVLNEYERKIANLDSNHNRDIDANNAEKEDLEKKLNQIEKRIKKNTADCKTEQKRKYKGQAAAALSSHISFFNIGINSQGYCGDKAYVDKRNAIRKDIEEKKRIEAEILEIENSIAQSEQKYENEKNKIINAYRSIYQNKAESINTSIALRGANPTNSTELPTDIFIGNVLRPTNKTLKYISDELCLRYGLSVNAKNGKSIIIDYAGLDENSCNQIFSALILRFLESFPASAAKVGIIDSEPCDAIATINNALSNGRIALTQTPVLNEQGINELLQGVTNQACEINNQININRCSNIFGLYDLDIERKFNLVFIKDIFKNNRINGDILTKLHNLFNLYYKCGVIVVWLDDFSVSQEYHYQQRNAENAVSNIKSRASVFTYKNGSFFDSFNNAIEFISLPSWENMNVFGYCEAYCEYLRTAASRVPLYENIGFDNDSHLESGDADSGNVISIPVGLIDNHVSTIDFYVKGTINSYITIGTTGSGKSALLEALILNGAKKYSPEELNFYFIDFADGTTSVAYKQVAAIPHMKVISAKNNASDADTILDNLKIEMRNRANKFKRLAGQKGKAITNIVNYNNSSSEKMPRIIVIIDECQHIFDEDGTTGETLSRKTECILREGRKYGIHLFLATQTMPRMGACAALIQGRCMCYIPDQNIMDQFFNNARGHRVEEIYCNLTGQGADEEPRKAFISKDGGQNISTMTMAFHNRRQEYYAEKIRNLWKEQPNVFVVGSNEVITKSTYEFKNLIKTNTNGVLEIPIGMNKQSPSNVFLRLNYAPKGSDHNEKNAFFMAGPRKSNADDIISSILLHNEEKQITTYLAEPRFTNSLSRLSNGSGYINHFDEDGYLTCLSEVYSIYCERKQNREYDAKPIMFIINAAHEIDDFKNNKKLNNQELRNVTQTSRKERKEAEEEFAKLMAIEVQKQQGAKTSFAGEDLIDAPVALATNQAPTPDETDNSIQGYSTWRELLTYGYKYNIIVGIYFDNATMIVNKDFGRTISFQDVNVIGNMCKNKILFGGVAFDQQYNLMEASFKSRQLNGLAKAECLLSQEEDISALLNDELPSLDNRFYFRFKTFNIK